MNHDLWIERLFTKQDGELSPAEVAEVDAHAASCAECRTLLDRWNDAVRRIRTASAAGAPPDFTARVMRRIRLDAAEAPRGLFPRIPRWIRGMGAAAAIAALVLVPRRPGTPPETAPDSTLYVAELFDAEFSGSDAAAESSVTSIEEYFL